MDDIFFFLITLNYFVINEFCNFVITRTNNLSFVRCVDTEKYDYSFRENNYIVFNNLNTSVVQVFNIGRNYFSKRYELYFTQNLKWQKSIIINMYRTE